MLNCDVVLFTNNRVPSSTCKINSAKMNLKIVPTTILVLLCSRLSKHFPIRMMGTNTDKHTNAIYIFNHIDFTTSCKVGVILLWIFMYIYEI